MATPHDTMAIQVNGEPHEAPSGVTVERLLRHIGRDPDLPGFAVAVNDAVVRRDEWVRATVHDGDRVEIVTASQGG
ncbi:MAG: sulfur carrier protein ThiS [Rubricoccaceae bacterium]|nr:sulfur carrier protein ThiS [Rubricoccaceae bacterium]